MKMQHLVSNHDIEQQQQSHYKLLEECLSIFHSLRMLSLHVVQCVIEWRKQLIYNFLMTQKQGT